MRNGTEEHHCSGESMCPEFVSREIRHVNTATTATKGLTYATRTCEDSTFPCRLLVVAGVSPPAEGSACGQG